MKLRDILGPDNVSITDILAERDQRAASQRRLLSIHGGVLVCLSLNMAGPVKDFPLLRCGYQEGQELTEQALRRAGCEFHLLEERQGKCGPCAFYQIAGNPLEIKRVLCAVEDATPLGRLLDLDVLIQSREKLSRQDVGLSPRGCLLCSRPAGLCGRSRRHSVEDLQRETIRRLLEYFSGRCADHAAACAARAMLYEVSVSPKPGLVDRKSNGAHQDMNFFTFLDSTAALTPWFRRLCLLGFQSAELEDGPLFSLVRCLGREAETEMLDATGGINTHRGLLFSLGLLCAAAGQLYSKRLCQGAAGFPSPEELCARAGKLAVCSLPDLERRDSTLSHGLAAFRDHHAGGVRLEASQGFPSVRKWVLPVLRQNGTLEESGKRALLSLFSSVEDTNVLHRGGPEALQAMAKQARRILSSSPQDLDAQLDAFDHELSQAHISPGGCADLLAVGYFLYFF